MKIDIRFQMSVVRLIIGFILLTTSYQILATSSLAQTSSSSAKINPKSSGIRKVVDNYEQQLDRVVDRADALLDNLQTKIITAKAGGRDTTEADSLIKKSRANMTDAKQKLNQIEKTKLSASQKNDWEVVKKDILTIKSDLKAVSLSVQRIIKLLT